MLGLLKQNFGVVGLISGPLVLREWMVRMGLTNDWDSTCFCGPS